jgi:hypothetical protein
MGWYSINENGNHHFHLFIQDELAEFRKKWEGKNLSFLGNIIRRFNFEQ